MKRVTALLPIETHRKLKELSFKQGRTLIEILAEAVDDYLKKWSQ